MKIKISPTREIRPAAFLTVAFCILTVSQVLSNVLASFFLMQMPERYSMYALIRSIGYVLLASICIKFMLKGFDLTAKECWIIPFKIKNLWITSPV